MSDYGKAYCVFTVDVEEWYHRNDMQIPLSAVNGNQGRVIENTSRLLSLFEESHSYATFFILGEIAERYPDLVRQISEAGHEVAAHGFKHRTVDSLTPRDFREDIIHVKALLEEFTDQHVIGYRAPCWSIGRANRWAWDILQEAGYQYDSSAGERGFMVQDDELPKNTWKHIQDGFMECPPSTIQLGMYHLNFGGFGFRLLPLAYSVHHTERLLRMSHVPTLYIHPWEIDEEFRYPARELTLKMRSILRMKSVGIASCAAKIRFYLKRFPSRTIGSTLAHLQL